MLNTTATPQHSALEVLIPGSSLLTAFSASTLVVCLTLAGCASPTIATADKQNTRVGQSDSEAKTKNDSINLTPYTSYEDKSNLGGKEDNKTANKLGGEFSDSYTRLLITSDLYADSNNNPGNEINALPYKPRAWLARSLAGKEFAVNFTAKVVVGSLEETIPLVTIGHESNSDGEKWSRVICHADRNHPLFLVKGNGSGAVPKITLTMHGSKSYASRGVASALQVVFGVANAVSPTSPVATTLSAQSSKDRAKALDNAISKLFGTDVKEEHTTTPDFRFWNAENNQPNGVNVTLNIPSGESWGDSDNQEQAKLEKKQVGIWTIAFDYPRPSIFSDWRICGTTTTTNNQNRCKGTKPEAQEQVLKEMDTAEVLNYDLLNDGQKLGTIRAYLTQQEWFTQAQTKLVAANAKLLAANNTLVAANNTQIKAKDNPVKNASNQMCRGIRNSITGLNLNGFDADIVAWAVFKGLSWPDDSPSFSEMREAEDCKFAIDRIETALGHAKSKP